MCWKTLVKWNRDFALRVLWQNYFTLILKFRFTFQKLSLWTDLAQMFNWKPELFLKHLSEDEICLTFLPPNPHLTSHSCIQVGKTGGHVASKTWSGNSEKTKGQFHLFWNCKWDITVKMNSYLKDIVTISSHILLSQQRLWAIEKLKIKPKLRSDVLQVA